MASVLNWMSSDMTYEILITGANRGLGLALTERLRANGHHIHATNRRGWMDRSLLPRTARHWSGNPGKSAQANSV